MIRRLIPFLAAIGVALWSVPALAHPHVFVTVKSTVDYADGAPRAVLHTWRFDDMFSAFAVQGLDADGDGSLSRAELADLAEVNVQSLKEFDYFTFGKAGSQDAVFKPPTDYWLDYDGTALTLHFTLPIDKAPRAANDNFRIEIYDPTYFVAFTLADERPATLAGAPDGCRIDTEAPKEEAAYDPTKPLSEEFFTQLDANSGFGAQFSNALVVRCGAEAQAYVPPVAAPAPPATDLTADDRAIETSAYDSPDVADRVAQAQTIASASALETLPAPGATAAPPSKEAGSAALGAFGVVRPDGAASSNAGLLGWVARQQSDFYRRMSHALMAAKADGSALFLLAGLSFAYGVFHAAGPGHGKAVISSYLIATGETLRRGLAISFAAAMAQAVTAVAIVGVMAGLLGVTSQKMGMAAWWLEMGSYVLIAGVGVNLIVRRGRALIAGVRGEADHVHDDNCGDGCGHSHAPSPDTLAGPFNWRRAGSAVLAIGLRPCTGALLILVFAMAQGMVWAGVAATFAMAVGTAITVSAIAILSVSAKSLALRLASGMSGGATLVAARGVELLAGVVVLVFGVALLGGLLSTGMPVG